MPGLPDNAPSWVAAIFFGLSLIVAFGRSMSEASEMWAKSFGPLGRRWRRRADERAARRRVEAPLALTRQQIQQMVDDAVEQKTTELTDELHELVEYLAYDAGWHRRATTAMSEGGFTMPPPEHLTLTQWRAERHTDVGAVQ